MLDWDDLRFFLVVSRHGNLSAAARELLVAQSTVGRRLASLELSLGVRLLNRTPEGYVPTLAGQDVLAQAAPLEQAAQNLERSVSGRDTRLVGPVRVTCAETIATHLLAPAFARLHLAHPDIMLELMPNARELSLSMREADISVRLKRPEQHDLVVRRIGNLSFGLYASPEYLDRHGAPDYEAGCPAQFCITQLEDIEDLTQMDWLAELAPRARISIQTSSHEAAVAAALHGAGLACLGCFRADREPGLVKLTTPSPVPRSSIWLVVHRDNRQMPRIRVVLSMITEHARAVRALLEPGSAAQQ